MDGAIQIMIDLQEMCLIMNSEFIWLSEFEDHIS
jgi:hypothetical protein